MNFNQGELNFDADNSEQGHKKWLAELDQRRKEMETRFGIILRQPVIVQLRGENAPLQGVISIVSTSIPKKRSQLLLKIGNSNRQFTLAQIETITSLPKTNPS